MPELRIAEDENTLADRAAEDVAGLIHAAVDRGEKFFHWVVSGGEAPRLLYERLASPPYDREIPWDRVRIFWADEGFASSSVASENVRLVSESLLRKVPIPPANIFVPRTNFDTVEDAADHYEKDLKYLFHVIPRFHLVLLGLGEDGSLASLFPKSPHLQEEHRWVVAVKGAPRPPAERITLTLPLINNAEQVMFLISGADKKGIVSRALHEPIGRYPCQYVWPTSGVVVWWLDRAAYPGGALS